MFGLETGVLAAGNDQVRESEDETRWHSRLARCSNDITAQPGVF